MGEDAATNDEPFARLADTDHWGRQLGIVRRTSDGALVARGQVRFQVLDQLPDERRR